MHSIDSRGQCSPRLTISTSAITQMEPSSYYYMHLIQPEWLQRDLLGTLTAERCVSYVRVYQKGSLLRDQCLFFLFLSLRGQRATRRRRRCWDEDESWSDSCVKCTLNKRSSHQWQGSRTEPDSLSSYPVYDTWIHSVITVPRVHLLSFSPLEKACQLVFLRKL